MNDSADNKPTETSAKSEPNRFPCYVYSTNVMVSTYSNTQPYNCSVDCVVQCNPVSDKNDDVREQHSVQSYPFRICFE